MPSSLHLGEWIPPVLVVVAYALAYWVRGRTLARQGRPLPWWRQAAFGAGLVAVLSVQAPPLDELSDRSLPAHMAQHLVLVDLAAFLIVVGVTGPMLAPALRLPGLRRLRPLTHPAVALSVWVVTLYAWHLPFLYQAALRHDLVHAVEHASFLWAGLLLWTALLGPLPQPQWFGTWARLGYVVIVRFAGALLANVLIWSQTVFYPYYEGHGATAALRAQGAAGALMMIEGMLLTILLLGWLFLRLAEQDEQRQRLLDLAAERGTVLDDARAARAAAAGSTAVLRRRLEGSPPLSSERGDRPAGASGRPPDGSPDDRSPPDPRSAPRVRVSAGGEGELEARADQEQRRGRERGQRPVEAAVDAPDERRGAGRRPH